MELIRIGLIGIVGVLLAVSFRSVKAEYGIYIGAAAGLLIFGYTMRSLRTFMDEIRLFQSVWRQDGGFFAILLKVVGMTYLCESCAGVCRDAGYAAVGWQVEMFGKIMVLLTGLPILLSVVETIEGFQG